MRILVLYGTSEGHTQKVATFVAALLRQRGHDVSLLDPREQPVTLRLPDFDAAIIAARVHAGLYQRRIMRFVRNNRPWLDTVPNAFLSVSMMAANLRLGDMARAEGYVTRFVRRTGWTPRRIVHVPGARLYTRHNAIGRWILGVVDRNLLDTARDHIWTDWAALERFAETFDASIVPMDAT